MNDGNLLMALPEEYIGSQILQSLLAKFHLVLTRSGDEELSIVPSNVAMASLSPSNYLVPTMAVNNILLGMGLHLEQSRNGSYDIVALPFGNRYVDPNDLRLAGDEPHTKLMETDIL